MNRPWVRHVLAQPVVLAATVGALVLFLTEYVGRWGVHFWPLRPITTGLLTLVLTTVVTVAVVDAEIQRRQERRTDGIISRYLWMVKAWTEDLRYSLDWEAEGASLTPHEKRLEVRSAIRSYELMLASMMPSLVTRDDTRNIVAQAQLMTTALREAEEQVFSLSVFDGVPGGETVKSDAEVKLRQFGEIAKHFSDEVVNECNRVSRLLNANEDGRSL